MGRHVDAQTPGPIHGWGDFLKEVGTIVLGVVIALAAGEMVDGYNWRQEVGIVKDSLDDELSDALFGAQSGSRSPTASAARSTASTSSPTKAAAR